MSSSKINLQNPKETQKTVCNLLARLLKQINLKNPNDQGWDTLYLVYASSMLNIALISTLSPPTDSNQGGDIVQEDDIASFRNLFKMQVYQLMNVEQQVTEDLQSLLGTGYWIKPGDSDEHSLKFLKQMAWAKPLKDTFDFTENSKLIKSVPGNKVFFSPTTNNVIKYTEEKPSRIPATRAQKVPGKGTVLTGKNPNNMPKFKKPPELNSYLMYPHLYSFYSAKDNFNKLSRHTILEGLSHDIEEKLPFVGIFPNIESVSEFGAYYFWYTCLWYCLSYFRAKDKPEDKEFFEKIRNDTEKVLKRTLLHMKDQQWFKEYISTSADGGETDIVVSRESSNNTVIESVDTSRSSSGTSTISGQDGGQSSGSQADEDTGSIDGFEGISQSSSNNSTIVANSQADPEDIYMSNNDQSDITMSDTTTLTVSAVVNNFKTDLMDGLRDIFEDDKDIIKNLTEGIQNLVDNTVSKSDSEHKEIITQASNQTSEVEEELGKVSETIAEDLKRFALQEDVLKQLKDAVGNLKTTLTSP